MQLRSLFCTGLSLAAFGLYGAPLLAQETVQEIITKVNARLKGAKTYQTTAQVEMTRGSKEVALMKVETMSVGNKSRTEGTIEMKKEGEPHEVNTLMITDSKKLQIAFWNAKEYHLIEVPLPKEAQQNFNTAIPENTDYVLLPTALLDDQPAYVLERVETKTDYTLTMTFYVDKATYRIKQSRSILANTEGATRYTITYKSEKLNEKIPDRLFKFTPPPGRKASNDGSPIAQNPAAMMMFGMMAGMSGGSRKE